MAQLAVGDPAEEATRIGPLARKDLRENLIKQVCSSEKLGAKVILGGEPLKCRGYFYSPTILIDVEPGMPVFDEEVFGPVASVIKVDNVEQALEAANNSRYGLGASIWTQDQTKGQALAARVESGAVFINGLVKSDPRLPFGGIKESGYGRELSKYGILEFVNAQTVWLK
jgi:succinate-semialdehyde dehydrogenase/glutarate-semialdehyde dehydrogenase